jgi:hypothetical protein
MIITEYEHWLVVRQSRRRRIYRVTLVATVSAYLERYVPLSVPAEQGGWFHATTVVSYPERVYRPGVCMPLE